MKRGRISSKAIGGKGHNGKDRISFPFSLQFWREEFFRGSHFFFLSSFLSLPFSLTNQTEEIFVFFSIFSSPISFFPVFFLTKQRVSETLHCYSLLSYYKRENSKGGLGHYGIIFVGVEAHMVDHHWRGKPSRRNIISFSSAWPLSNNYFLD